MEDSATLIVWTIAATVAMCMVLPQFIPLTLSIVGMFIICKTVAEVQRAKKNHRQKVGLIK